MDFNVVFTVKFRNEWHTEKGVNFLLRVLA